MVFAIILAVLVVIIGVLAIIIRLFKLEKQYLVCQKAFLRWIKKVFACICIFFRVVGIGIAHFFMAIGRFFKKIFSKKEKKEKEKKVREKKSKETKPQKEDTEKKSGRVVRQFSHTRPVLLPPKESEEESVEEKNIEEEKTDDSKETENVANSEVSIEGFQPLSGRENDFEEDDAIEDVPFRALPSSHLMGQNSMSQISGAPNYSQMNPDSQFSRPNGLPSPAEISRMRQEAIFREQQKAMSSYENPNGRQFRLSTQSFDASREAEERRRHLEETLQSLRQSMERKRAEEQSQEDSPIPASFQFKRTFSPQSVEEKKAPSIRDFMGKNSLTPRNNVKQEPLAKTIDVDKIDLNKLPENMRKQIIMEYLGNNPEKED